MYRIEWTREKEAEALDRITAFFEEYGDGKNIINEQEAVYDGMDCLIGIADNVLRDGITRSDELEDGI